ncbi:hypothetical protein [Nostoc sp. ChiVER01]|uniref:hypothetical protein n=1 Tax=Nostoc sp. ChiVER01 TaxID=3075382 RepID=UPI002AD3D90D|nr:hypothetical protein [Nostoc sp. ChiVER01]MDZ8227530.1 hypothetical protein [Nostoc sp. ChiVER01]
MAEICKDIDSGISDLIAAVNRLNNNVDNLNRKIQELERKQKECCDKKPAPPPTDLRALSRYANGQPGKLLLEAKRVKRVTSQFMSKSGAREAAKRMRALKKVVSTTKKASDLTEKIQAALFKNVPGSEALDKASRVGGILGILAAIGAVAILKLNEFVSSRTFDNLDAINNDLTKTNQLAVQAGLKLKTLDAKVQKFEKELDTNAKDYYRLNKQQETFGKDLLESKKKANDSLYETREGRKILEGKISEVKKQANDSLYETREGRKILEGKISDQKTSFESKIQQLNNQISKFTSGVSDGFQKSVNATISKIQSDLASTRAKVDAIRPQTPTDTAAINANAVAAARAIINPLQSQVGQLAGVVGSVQGQVAQIPVLVNSIGNLAQNLNSVNAKADAAMNEARNKGVPNLAPLQQQLDDKFNRFVADNNKALGIVGINQSNLAKEFDSKLADFNRLSNLTSEQRFNQFKAENEKALGIVKLDQSNLAKEFDAKFNDFQRQSNLTADQRFEEFQRQNKADLGLIKSSLTTTQSDIKQIDTKVREQAKVNDLALPKLDQIVGMLGLIPARAAAAIRPDIPTIPQIETAAATGTCRTTQPGGCMNKALKDNAADITNNNNTNAANILDAVNTGANAALLQGQETILRRLGDQLPGGIGGKLSRFADWMHLDRVLNILIFAATIHNALMLSNDIGQTLIGAINNVLQLIGLKKEDGSAFDIGSVISGSIENLIKEAIGADNYVELKEAWAKANRIYQATTNVLNSFLNLSQTILQASELIAAYTGKIGNALKKGGVILEDAYGWMNPQPKFNRVTSFLENLQNGASTIQMVTQAPLDIVNATTDLTTASTEFVKAVKEDDKEKNKGIPTPEPDELKAKEQESKTDSQPFSFDFADLFDGED